MCNDYRLRVDVGTIIEEFADLKIRIRFGEGVPNLEPRDDIRITDPGPIIRRMGDTDDVELVQRRWTETEQSRTIVMSFSASLRNGQSFLKRFPSSYGPPLRKQTNPEPDQT